MGRISNTTKLRKRDADMKRLFPIQASPLLQVHADPLPFQHDMDAPVAETPAFAGNSSHGLTQIPVV